MPIGLILLSMLGPQIWAIAKRKSAVFRMTWLALSLVSVSAFYWGRLRLGKLGSGPIGAQDTYSMVSSFYHFSNLALPTCALTVLLAATARWAAPLPRAAAWGVNLFVVCMTVMASRPWWSGWLVERPKRYEDYETYLVQLIRIDTLSGIISALVFCSLVVACLASLLRRLNQWSKTG